MSENAGGAGKPGRKAANPGRSLTRSSAAEYLTFLAAAGQGGVEAIYADENVWLTQKMMVLLYDVETQTINYHLKKVFADRELAEGAGIRSFRIAAADGKLVFIDASHDNEAGKDKTFMALLQTTPQNVTQHVKAIYAEGEAERAATCKPHLQVRQEGGRQVRRTIQFYSLDMILAVGYRVKSPRGTQFRQWASAHLREYLVKGFVLDDERMKDLQGWDYFDELRQRIRDIRASETRFYQKVRDPRLPGPGNPHPGRLRRGRHRGPVPKLRHRVQAPAGAA